MEIHKASLATTTIDQAPTSSEYRRIMLFYEYEMVNILILIRGFKCREENSINPTKFDGVLYIIDVMCMSMYVSFLVFKC